jgi:hypothetical protein
MIFEEAAMIPGVQISIKIPILTTVIIQMEQ